MKDHKKDLYIGLKKCKNKKIYIFLFLHPTLLGVGTSEQSPKVGTETLGLCSEVLRLTKVLP